MALAVSSTAAFLASGIEGVKALLGALVGRRSSSGSSAPMLGWPLLGRGFFAGTWSA